MKHIIIGGDGFVGSHLAADLVGRSARRCWSPTSSRAAMRITPRCRSTRST
jgi:nucleoside-diphosphate-sugar epimerase